MHFKHHENYTPRTGKHKCHLCKEAFFQKDMLKRHVLSTHNEVSSFRSRGKQPSKSRRHCHTATSLKGGLISDGIFTLVPSSKKPVPNHYPQLLNLNLAYHIYFIVSEKNNFFLTSSDGKLLEGTILCTDFDRTLEKKRKQLFKGDII